MNKIKIFYSYSHEDETYRLALEKWLTVLRNDGYIEEWHDRKILPGDNWNLEIGENEEKSDIILLLFSQDFISSCACTKEMKYAFRKKKEKRIIPIILKTCTWHDICGDIQALPKDGVPIDEWDKVEKAWENIYEGIKKVVNCLRESFNLKSDFEKDINKTEFVMQNKEHLFIDDIFIFPNIKHSGINSEKESDVENLEAFINTENKNITLVGNDLSGKTTICKQLFKKSIKGLY
ncbi:MAG: toll/interleukin-1 receptor domain-containing protein [Candidatus Atribacteria bacterium]|nr:toll/interleukin-1 receptor domain-containing protein [Candidatus Atribacteria bacterium]